MLGKGWTPVFHFREADNWGKEPIREKQLSFLPKVAAGSERNCVFISLRLSLHIIKETAVCCEIKLESRCVGIWYPWRAGGREAPLLPGAPCIE